MKRISSLREMSNDQLKNKLRQLRMDIMRAKGHNAIPPRERASGGDVKFLHRMEKTRARILTILSERGFA